jgi:2-oxo-hept-3-ene-1,7-dioate hydratase
VAVWRCAAARLVLSEALRENCGAGVMLDKTTIAALARELHQAEKTRVQVEHFSKRYPGMTIEDGYAIQREWVTLKRAEGRKISGHKIGLTSRAMQMASQINEPDYGALLDDMFFQGGDDIPFQKFIAPRIEVELGFVLAKRLEGPNVTLADVLAATDYVVPALEIIDARIEQFDRDTRAPRKVFDTIADFAANAGVVPGGRPVAPDAFDLRWVGALLYKNSVIEETGLAAGVLNHPATGVAWLANKIAKYDEQLNAGDFVMSGSFTRPTQAAKGDVLHADYGPLGNVAFRFV